MTGSSETVLTFAVAGIYGAARLASRLKELESVDLIGPWHAGHWIDHTHTAIRIRFSSRADARKAFTNVAFSAGPPLEGSATNAAVHLVQTVLTEDFSLHVAQNRIADLEKSLAEAQTIPFLPPGLLLDEAKTD